VKKDEKREPCKISSVIGVILYIWYENRVWISMNVEFRVVKGQVIAIYKKTRCSWTNSDLNHLEPFFL
jgi:hypothetical protein